jgi:hypothetical protein
MRAILCALLGLAVTACAPNPTVLPPSPDTYPAAPERLLDPANCPDADPDGEGVLHDPADGTAGAVLDARGRNGEMYVRCRAAFEGLVDHERERMRRQREKAMEGSGE